MDVMTERIVRVLSLEAEVFSDIEHDEGATGQAAIVVAVSAVLAAIGASLRADSLTTGFVTVLIWALLGWYLWSAVTYLIGTKLFGGEATMGEMLRVIGYAQAPRAFGVLTFLPLVGFAILLLTFFYTLGTSFMAIREGLDIGPGRTLLTAFLGWLAYLVGLGVILALVGALT